MTFDDISIRYHGFHPSDYLRAFWDSTMREIHEEAPYGAYLQASLSKKNDLYKGVLRINSPVGPFFSTATGENPYSVAKKLFEQIRRRISKWKSNRFRFDKEKHKYKQVITRIDAYDSDVA